MKSLTWIVGLSGIVAFSAWACGDEVEENPTTATSNTTGTSTGGGPASGSTTTTSTASSTGSGMNCSMSADVCEEACCHVEQDCGIANGCALAMQFLMIDLTDCTNETSECLAECIAPADCGAIGSLIGNTPDPDLQACVAACAPPGCAQCVASSCLGQLMACQNAPACAAFLMCAQSCPEGDGACFQTCADMNPSLETTDVVNCASTNCASQCLGAGGGGGAGGN